MRTVVILLALSTVGCDLALPSAQGPPAAAANAANAAAAAGMSKYPYLAADGGPHMLLPSGAPGVNYAQACAATAAAQMAVMPAGSGTAVIFADPPMTAWGTSSDGLVEVYYLGSWTQMNLDGLIATATAALPTASLTNTGSVLQLPQADAFLLFAGDTPTRFAYDCHRVTIPAGKYSILTGTYAAKGESVTVYRLKPAGGGN